MEVISGEAVASILSVVDARHIDLIVMASHGYKGKPLLAGLDVNELKFLDLSHAKILHRFNSLDERTTFSPSRYDTVTIPLIDYR